MHHEVTLLDRLNSPTTMMEAEQELLTRGEACVSVLTAILDNTATNAFGVAYGRLGLPRQCAQEMAVRLGPNAKPLERLLTTDASNGHTTAVRALAALGSLEAASVKALVENMTSADFELAEESARALVKTGHAGVAKAAATTRRLQGLIAKWSL